MVDVRDTEVVGAAVAAGGTSAPGLRGWLVGVKTSHRLPLKTRVIRYSAGSVVAVGVSEATLTLLVGLARMAAGPAAVLAFLAGAVPNWILNRQWAWEQDGPVRVRRELVPYVAIVLATLAATAGASAAVDAATQHASHWVSVVAVDAAYIAATGVMFVVKFVLFDRFVFTPRGGPSAPIAGDPES